MASGAVSLVGLGDTAPGDVGALLLTAPSSAVAALVLGTDVQWLGPGTLAPSLSLLVPIVLGGQVTAIPYTWPAGYPPTMTAVFVQAWAADVFGIGKSELLAVVTE
jgi:hypothetical protein